MSTPKPLHDTSADRSTKRMYAHMSMDFWNNLIDCLITRPDRVG